jgi:hypothetical protein
MFVAAASMAISAPARGVTTLENLAVTRLRRSSQDRAAIRHGKTVRLDRDGWIERRSRAAGARQVNVIDFEFAFDSLADSDQIALLLSYRDQFPAVHVGDVLRASPSLSQWPFSASSPGWIIRLLLCSSLLQFELPIPPPGIS